MRQKSKIREGRSFRALPMEKRDKGGGKSLETEPSKKGGGGSVLVLRSSWTGALGTAFTREVEGKQGKEQRPAKQKKALRQKDGPDGLLEKKGRRSVRTQLGGGKGKIRERKKRPSKSTKSPEYI